jgi:hypothetical protein
MPKWGKGESGNPRGRKPGSGSVAKLRASLVEHVPDIIASLVSAAKDGDTAAAKLILERVVPAKSEELAVRFPLPSRGLAEQGGAVLVGMAKGGLAPTQAAAMLAALASQARLIETEDLARRLTALEEATQGRSRK